MKKELIDIIVVCGRHGANYAKILRKTGEMLKSNHYQLNWNCITTPKYREVPDGFVKLHDLEPTSSDGGIIHGEGLVAGIRESSAKYVLITDSDIILLRENWDLKLVKKLQGNTIIVGFEWGGEFEKECYQGFPCTTFSLFDGEIVRPMNINLVQGAQCHTVKLKNEKTASLFNSRAGKNLILETGWRLPLRLKRAGYKGHTLKKIVPFDKRSNLKWAPKDLANHDPSHPYRTRVRWIAKKAGNHVMHEFYLDKELFASHMRRSRKYGITNKMTEAWLNKIKIYLKDKYGKKLKI